MAKNIYAVSMVKNESDIIESFCRHTLTFCDGMLICDDESVDDTKQIIYNLMDEGLNITLLDNTNTFGHYQGEIITSLARMAVNDFNADLILPLDADEFFTTFNYAATPREALEALTDSDLKFSFWFNFIPSDTPRDNSTFLPMYFKQFFNYGCAFEKLIIGAKWISERGAAINLGNHNLFLPTGENITGEPVSNLIILHYPIRSVAQAMTKAIVGWANTLCVPGRTYAYQPHHWRDMYNEIKKSGTLEFEKLKDFAKVYCNSQDVDILKKDIPVVDYEAVSSIVLKYTDYAKAQNNFMNIILSNYEHIIATFMSGSKGE